MKKYLHIIKNNLVLPMVTLFLLLSIILYIYIPLQMASVIEQQTITNATKTINNLSMSRAYYTKYVVEDILKYNKDIKFSENHKNNHSVPLPATYLSDLADGVTTDKIKVKLYSNYPFKGNKRVLTERQKTVLKEIESLNSGVYINKEIKDGVKYLRVAKIDYMTSQGCVDCHNNHINKTWDFNWKVGDARGVLEVLQPIDEEILITMDSTRNIIITMVLSSMLVLLIYYSRIFIKREGQLEEENKELTDKFNKAFSNLNNKNKNLKSDLTEMYNDFDKHVIYSNTDLFGVITEVSDAFCTISEFTRKELLGQPHSIVRHPDMKASAFKGMWTTIENNNVWTGEVKNLKKDGGFYRVNAIISPQYDNKGVKIGYTSIRHLILD